MQKIRNMFVVLSFLMVLLACGFAQKGTNNSVKCFETSLDLPSGPAIPHYELNITFDLGNGVKTLPASSLYLRSAFPIIDQATNIDLGDNGHAWVVISSYIQREEASYGGPWGLGGPWDPEDQFNFTEIGNYGTSLANGTQVTVHQRTIEECGKYDYCQFEPDNSTVVKVISTMDRDKMKALLKTLKVEKQHF